MVRKIASGISYFCSANLKQMNVKTFSLSCIISFTNLRIDIGFTADRNNDEYNLFIVSFDMKEIQRACSCWAR